MFGVRIHGRGGQGVVTAAELLAAATFSQRKHAQAFPSFGSERMGAPVTSFCRIDSKPIRTREPVTTPDAVIIQDPTLVRQADVFAGLQPNGYLLVNSAREFADLGIGDLIGRFRWERMLVVPATQLAVEHLGRPLPGAPLLGGFAALTGQVSLDAVVSAIRERFSGQVAEGNAAAAVCAPPNAPAVPSPWSPSRPEQTRPWFRVRGRRGGPAAGRPGGRLL
jgi:pyruvate ferredoxin oxidoreductase gamma subunit